MERKQPSFSSSRYFQNIHAAQRGLFESFQKYGKFVSVFLDKHKKSTSLMRRLILSYKTLYAQALHSGIRIIIAFNPVFWKNCGCLSIPEPRPDGEYLIKNSRKFRSSNADIFFFIKSDFEDEANNLLSDLLNVLLSIGIDNEHLDVTESVLHELTHVLSGQFQDGLINIGDPETANRYIMIGENGSGDPAGTYMFTQKFEIDWDIYESKTKSQKEMTFGRKMYTNEIIMNSDSRRHVKCAHVVDDVTIPWEIMNKNRTTFRESMPYGKADGRSGREKGIYFVALARSTNVFQDILKGLAGKNSSINGGTTHDSLISLMLPQIGDFWYVPSANELQIPYSGFCRIDLHPFWQVKSKNGLLFYNHRYYLNQMTTDCYIMKDAPSSRVLRLMQYTFDRWTDTWFQKFNIPQMPHLQEVLSENEKEFMAMSIPIRKGMAIKKSLSEVLTTTNLKLCPHQFYGWIVDSFSIHPSEIIVGRMPRGFSLGLGKVVMSYLTEEERMSAFLRGLSEGSAVGHVIPDHAKLLRMGVGGILKEIESYLNNKNLQNVQRDFYISCMLAIEGLQMYIANYAKLAQEMTSYDNKFTYNEISNLKEIAERMTNLTTNPPKDFIEAAQLVFTMHCCLHQIGQPVAVGRIDQLLEPYLSTIHPTKAQDVIDCFWIKFGERVQLTPFFANDLAQWGQCALPYTTDGKFVRGDSINQWVQQITVGGYKGNNSIEPESACNAITLMCLKAARRLPLNAPCLSLRVHNDIPTEYLDEAAAALLSGGAHPIILQDDRLTTSIENANHLTETTIPREDARNIACDGCYEPIIAGKSEFSFTYINLLNITELTLNEGKFFDLAGPAYLSGNPGSFKTPSPDDIKSFEEFQEYFKLHLEIQIEKNICGTLQNYGNIWNACPAPLLSSVLEGCLETGRDLYNGGAAYRLFGCMFIAFSNCIDALYTIKTMCFDEYTASVSLRKLLSALVADWGFKIQEPFVDDDSSTTISIEEVTDIYKDLREQVLTLPKFGTDAGAKSEELQSIVEWLSNTVVITFRKVVSVGNPKSNFCKLMKDLSDRYSVPNVPFDILFVPGSGTFEGYVGWGLSTAASADGRRCGMPIASDFSAAPTIQDGPEQPTYNDIYKSLKSWDNEYLNYGFPNGAEIDLNINEDFSKDDLSDFLNNFANEREIGGNVLTFTCADVETYQKAVQSPEKYNLLRVRMGGWSEMFIAMFHSHQKQHIRRPYYKC